MNNTFADEALRSLQEMLNSHNEENPWLGVVATVALLKMSTKDPIPMLLWCPLCHHRHIDEGEFATKKHHTHACQNCGGVWRPAVVPTVGVQFLPGFKNEPEQSLEKE